MDAAVRFSRRHHAEHSGLAYLPVKRCDGLSQFTLVGDDYLLCVRDKGRKSQLLVAHTSMHGGAWHQPYWLSIFALCIAAARSPLNFASSTIDTSLVEEPRIATADSRRSHRSAYRMPLTQLYHTRDPIENLRVHVALRKVTHLDHVEGVRSSMRSHVPCNRSRLQQTKTVRTTRRSALAPRGTTASVGRRRSSRPRSKSQRLHARGSRCTYNLAGRHHQAEL